MVGGGEICHNTNINNDPFFRISYFLFKDERKMKKQFLILSIFTLFAIPSVEKTEASELCGNVKKFICKETKEERYDVERESIALTHKILKEKEANTKKSLKQENGNKLTIERRELIKAIDKYLLDLENQVINQENINAVKSSLVGAIENSHFNEVTKTSMKKRIEEVQVLHFSQFLTTPALKENLIQHGFKICGPAGLKSNATAIATGNKYYVLICPGYLLGLKNMNPREQLETVFQMLSHEMGHHIGKTYYPAEYGNFFSCVAENYASDLSATKEDRIFCLKNSKERCNQKIAQSHGSELVADMWAIMGTAHYMKTNSYSTEEVQLGLKRTWAQFCSTRDEGIHPSGNFRIEHLLRKDQQINDLLLCGNEHIKKKVSCSFYGKINI